MVQIGEKTSQICKLCFDSTYLCFKTKFMENNSHKYLGITTYRRCYPYLWHCLFKSILLNFEARNRSLSVYWKITNNTSWKNKKNFVLTPVVYTVGICKASSVVQCITEPNFKEIIGFHNGANGEVQPTASVSDPVSTCGLSANSSNRH